MLERLRVGLPVSGFGGRQLLLEALRGCGRTLSSWDAGRFVLPADPGGLGAGGSGVPSTPDWGGQF